MICMEVCVEAEIDPFRSRIGFLLRQSHHLIRTRCDEALRSIGLTTPQFALLKVLDVQPGLSGADLARASLLTPQTMHPIIRNLEDRGLIKRALRPTDSRVREVEITEAGRQALSDADARVTAVETDFTQQLGEAGEAQLRALICACLVAQDAWAPAPDVGPKT